MDAVYQGHLLHRRCLNQDKQELQHQDPQLDQILQLMIFLRFKTLNYKTFSQEAQLDLHRLLHKVNQVSQELVYQDLQLDQMFQLMIFQLNKYPNHRFNNQEAQLDLHHLLQ